MNGDSEETRPEPWKPGHEVAVASMIELFLGSAYPGLGSAIATAVSGIFAWRRERVREFGLQVLSEVAPEELLKRLRHDRRFGELFVLALERVAVSGWDQKRRAMGRVILQALAGDETELDDSERVLTALEELDAGDFAVLARLDAERRARDEAGSKTEIDVEAIRGLKDSVGPLLRHRALVQETAFGAMGYRPTPLGRKLLHLVSLETA